jgi:hypothetical protein
MGKRRTASSAGCSCAGIVIIATPRPIFFAYAPVGSGLADLAGAAGLRWTIEECFLRAEQRRTAFTKADKTRPAASTSTDRPCPETSPHPNLRKLLAKLLLPLQRTHPVSTAGLIGARGA